MLHSPHQPHVNESRGASVNGQFWINNLIWLSRAYNPPRRPTKPMIICEARKQSDPELLLRPRVDVLTYHPRGLTPKARLLYERSPEHDPRGPCSSERSRGDTRGRPRLAAPGLDPSATSTPGSVLVVLSAVHKWGLHTFYFWPDILYRPRGYSFHKWQTPSIINKWCPNIAKGLSEFSLPFEIKVSCLPTSLTDLGIRVVTPDNPPA